MALTTSRSVNRLSMEMRGLQELRRALQTAPELVRERLAGAVASSTFRIAQSVRARAPRDTGTLRNSVSSRATGLRGRVEIGADAWYWHFLEYGTVKMSARPFVRPSAEEEAPNFERAVTQAGRALEQSWARAA